MKCIKYFFIVLLLLLLMLTFFNLIDWKHHYFVDDSKLHVALVGPGPDTEEGKLFKNAVELYFEKINKKEKGINGKQLVCDIYDDQNCSSKASTVSLEVVKDKNKALAVIGHWVSSCSVVGGQAYKQKQVPAITPGSTDISVTKYNDWYFRQIYNNKVESSFLVNYASEILEANSLTIINEDLLFGKTSAENAYETAKSLDMTVKYKFEFSKNDPVELKNQLSEIVNKLKDALDNEEDLGIIMLCTKVREGIELVRQIKDLGIKNTIMGPLGFATEPFRNGFDQLTKEKSVEGFYTDNLYVSTPLLFDTANEQAQSFKNEFKKKYGLNPDWGAACYYDAAKLIVEAIKRSSVTGTSETLAEDRKKIRNYLSSIMNEEKQIEGITGPIYFDRNGDAVKTVSVGVYKQKNLISPLYQIQLITDHENYFDLSFDRMMEIDGKDMYKTNVVYTGIEILSVKDIDTKNFTFNAEFYIWFKYQGDIEPYDYEVQNQIELSEVKEIKKDKDDTYNIITFKVSGKFKMDIDSLSYAFDEYKLPIRIYHKKLTFLNLIYVVDYIGMGLTQNKTITEKLMESNVIENPEKWIFKECLIYPNKKAKEYFRIPGFNIQENRSINYSQYNFVITIKQNKLSLRGYFSYNTSKKILIYLIAPIFVPYLILLFIFWIKNYKIENIFFNMKNNGTIQSSLSEKKRNRRKTILKFKKNLYFRLFRLNVEACFALVFLLSLEVILLMQKYEMHYIIYIRTFFDVLWFLAVAFFIDLGNRRILKKYKSETKVSMFLPNFMSFIIFLTTTLLILSLVFSINITKLLATGGVLAMIIGLAVQMNIADLISAIAIHLEKPFRSKDWIKVGDYEGEVIDTNWRATLLSTGDSTVICVPNHLITDSTIINYDYRDEEKMNEEDEKTIDYNCIELTVHINHYYDPERVEKILIDAVLTANTILIKKNIQQDNRIIEKDKLPECDLHEITDFSADYSVRFFIRNVGEKNICIWAVWKRIWVHLAYAGIEFAFNPLCEPKKDMKIFDSFHDPFRKLAAIGIDTKKLKQVVMKPGEKLSKSLTNTVLLIKEGVVRVQNFGHSITPDLIDDKFSVSSQTEYETYLIGAGSILSQSNFLEIVTQTIFLEIQLDDIRFSTEDIKNIFY